MRDTARPMKLTARHRRSHWLWAALAVPFALALPDLAAAQGLASGPLVRDRFSIGDSSGALCEVQSTNRDPVLSGMFDRSWLILCRDASQPVGRLRALRSNADDAAARTAAARTSIAECDAGGQNCISRAGGGAWSVRTRQVGNTSFVVEGLEAYADALNLALQSVIDNRIAPGTINVATVSAGGADSFARDLAGSIDIDKALGEGYRRNHSGEYAEAAEFFEALNRRSASDVAAATIDPTEFDLNRALQKSNLGEFGEAERLFAIVEAVQTTDIVQVRLRRNYRAIHALNLGDLEEAQRLLAQPVPALPTSVAQDSGAIRLGRDAVAGLNSGNAARVVGGEGDNERLTPEERARIIDAQAVHLSGTVQRLNGNASAAAAAQLEGLTRALAVREGRVTSIIRLRSQMLGELARAEEMQGNVAAARTHLDEAIALLTSEYPETMALAGARARLASFLMRNGERDAAIVLYRTVVGTLAEQRRTLTGMVGQMAPYFSDLAERSDADPQAAADLFLASQLLVRPGAADTQAVLARELAGGTADASRLFRQATNLARDIERLRVNDARLAQLPPSADIAQTRSEIAAAVQNLGNQQTATLAALAAFPQYRAIEQSSMTLAELQGELKAGEAYAKMMLVGDTVYAMLVQPDAVRAWRADLDKPALDRAVDAVRASISVMEGGRRVTYPFDAAAAYRLYRGLFGPVAAQLPGIRHVIFEPDGAMLRLPPNLLVTSEAGLAAHQARLADPNADAFDTRGIQFLGKTTRASTVVSTTAFRNARRTPPSRAAREYLGLGENAPVSDRTSVARTRSMLGNARGDAGCDWSLDEWNRPISAAELVGARTIIGDDRSDLMTGAAFTDVAVRQRADLADFRILHFATHGLVTAPRAGCPARPALLTSFAEGDDETAKSSDGLLAFEDIFDLRIDADLVILSACDTAGGASIAATRAAGVATGGGTALDGLVRAFIGAGGRSVIASHWPVPDDFDATKRLIGGLFQAPAGTGVADALHMAQQELMRDVRTSHPYYWSGFAIVGDGSQALLHQQTAGAEGALGQQSAR